MDQGAHVEALLAYRDDSGAGITIGDRTALIQWHVLTTNRKGAGVRQRPHVMGTIWQAGDTRAVSPLHSFAMHQVPVEPIGTPCDYVFDQHHRGIERIGPGANQIGGHGLRIVGCTSQEIAGFLQLPLQAGSFGV